jgi:C-terminal processing protease CtpA/Prc
MVSNELGDVQTLKDFNTIPGILTRDDQKAIVEMAIVLLEQAYVHLPLKVAMHAVNPIRRLRILQNRLEESGPDRINHELNFHEEMLNIFTSLRDLHTNYLLPHPFSKCTAILPFFVESYVKDTHQATSRKRQREMQFIVTGILSPDQLKDYLPPNFKFHIPATFKRGVEITYWNGVPMQRAVDINAHKKAGSNSAARFKRGLEDMTIRPMDASLPPDEEWVVIGYRTEDGQDLEYRQEWLIVLPNTNGVRKEVAKKDAKSTMSDYSLKIGMDLTTDRVRKMKQIMFAPQHVIESERILSKARFVLDLVKEAESLASVIKGVFKAKKISEDIGYIRIYTFSGEKPDTISHGEWIDAMVEEFRRLIMKLPKKGLIIDVRGNGGGYIPFAERILQFLTPQEITPEPYSFVSSPLTLELTQIFSSDPDYKYWNSSISEALTTGSIFSGGHPLTDIDEMNSVGQVYHGPVILVTDALCYSATDLFAASFQDHKIGEVLGVDENTGAGGANVWKYDDLSNALAGSRFELKQIPYVPFRLSLRRNVRTGEHAGTPVEDLGIKPEIIYNMTKRDLLEENVDLIKKASEILAGKQVRQLEALISDQNDALKIEVVSIGISRVDIYVDNRPVLSQDVVDGTNKLSIGKPNTGSRLLKFIGMEGNNVVAAKKVFL